MRKQEEETAIELEPVHISTLSDQIVLTYKAVVHFLLYSVHANTHFSIIFSTEPVCVSTEE